MRQVITVPAAGEELQVKITGRSILIEFANLYTEPAQVPLLGFNSGNDQFPIYPRSVYQCQSGEFNGLIITGTTESAGDTIILNSVKECLPSDININFLDSYSLEIKPTFDQTLNNDVFSFSEAQLLNGAEYPVRAVIQVTDGATAGMAYAFDVDPTQAGFGFKWDRASGLLELLDFSYISGFRALAEVAGETPKITVQFEYRK